MKSKNNKEGVDGLRRKLLLVGAGLSLQAAFPAATLAATGIPGPLRQPASMTPRASQSVLTSVKRAGDRLVAMGERGLVLLSDDGGRQWRQANVPVSVTLTSASFIDDRQGWIAGHSGVVLHTKDGGENWVIQTDGVALAKAALMQAKNLPDSYAERERSIRLAQRLVDDGADKPLLSINFADAQRGMAVGAFGLAAITRDGGKTWVPCGERLPNPWGMHLYSATHHGKNWVIAGEQGVLACSRDDGASFQSLESPVERSYFAGTALRDGGFVLAGLLGAACRVGADGSAVTAIELPALLTILCCTELHDGRVMLLAQGGRLFVSSDAGVSFSEQQLPRRAPLTSLAEAVDGGLVATSLGGVLRLG